MKIYKHYSFDLWMTLIRSNPDFKKERTRFFYDHFNTKGKTLEEVGLIFRQVDVMCNAINEKTGGNIQAEEMYLMVISAVNDYVYPLQDVNMVQLYEEMEALVLKHLPLAYDADTVKVLKQLKSAGGSTFSLLSNTAFIKGRTLRTVLQHLEMDQYFHFQLYSDEAGMSKPNEAFFDLMVKVAERTRAEKMDDRKVIIHVGDNSRADISGAEKAGVSSLLINSNYLTILNLVS
jgi:putative hydrolase of the HAD superfamily